MKLFTTVLLFFWAGNLFAQHDTLSFQYVYKKKQATHFFEVSTFSDNFSILGDKFIASYEQNQKLETPNISHTFATIVQTHAKKSKRFYIIRNDLDFCWGAPDFAAIHCYNQKKKWLYSVQYLSIAVNDSVKRKNIFEKAKEIVQKYCQDAMREYPYICPVKHHSGKNFYLLLTASGIRPLPTENNQPTASWLLILNHKFRVFSFHHAYFFSSCLYGYSRIFLFDIFYQVF